MCALEMLNVHSRAYFTLKDGVNAASPLLSTVHRSHSLIEREVCPSEHMFQRCPHLERR